MTRPLGAALLLLLPALVVGQSDSAIADGASPSRIGRYAALTRREAHRAVDVVFEVDSMTSTWTTRQDPTSRFMRAAAPVAFWIPPMMVVAAPWVWAEESGDRHAINAQYARAATQGLLIGFAVSRTTKALVHRRRPCAVDSVPRCPNERLISARSSFFSEHTTAAFSVASAVAFEAVRRNEPNVELISSIGIGTATLVGLGRLYSHHHWLSDVLVGAAVGTASGFAGAALSGKPVSPHNR
jgi:membrane-associated phospholipid phosphatase